MTKKDNIYGVIIVILLVVIGVVAAFRVFKASDKEMEDKSRTMIKIESRDSTYSNFDIFYDSQTKVMYIINYHGGVAVMLNPDGTPKLYEEK